ncbi:FAD-binding oxidoreductase [Actinophytocola oryzae]|uniref:FAD/FMN-containing dehydrogenase n=1 Tax=Actinophytocola oryzae TaxID=502181 RepID=A0A4R7W083_9PSEU|nr:FAD-binding oxidoreductase [Actinophytocola oryzae]TDV55229.1 FAD/FMN-containing dehydrogenase [Actinophytocola oryzae]
MDTFFAGDKGYDDEIAGFQTLVRHQPEMVVAASSADDLAEAVRQARDRGLRVAVQATGHGIRVPADGLLVTTRRMSGVRVDPDARTAWVEAGARGSAVIEAAAAHGLAPVVGSSPGVGAVGFTLAGGFGLLGRTFGYATDHVRAIDVVTSDGRLRRVTATSEPDLFWALRGGGEPLGLVAGMEIALLPLPVVHGGGLHFDAEHAADVLTAFRDLTAAARDTLTASVGMIGLPPIDAVPEPLRGRHVLHVRLASTEPLDPALLAPLRAIGPLVDRVGEVPATEVGSIYGEPDFPHPYVGDNVLLGELPPTLLDAVRTLAGPTAPVPCIVDIRQLGGAMARTPEVPDAVPFRGAAYVLRVLSSAEDVEAARSAHHEVFAAAAPFAVGRAAAFSYGPPDDDPSLPALRDRATAARLSEVRKVVDPEGLLFVGG